MLRYILTFVVATLVTATTAQANTHCATHLYQQGYTIAYAVNVNAQNQATGNPRAHTVVFDYFFDSSLRRAERVTARVAPRDMNRLARYMNAREFGGARLGSRYYFFVRYPNDPGGQLRCRIQPVN